MSSITWTWSLICALAWASAAEAGVIRGVLRAPAATPAGGEAPSRYRGRADALAQVGAVARGAVTDAVISIARVPPAVESSLARPKSPSPKLAQKDQRFAPRVLAIAAGTTVEFPNLDPIFHNVFSISPPRRFDLGKYPRGQSRRVTFSKPGLVEVYCDIHSNMSAFVLVLPNHAFTRPEADGSFALPELPAGRYALRVWHPDLREIRRDIVVPVEGDVDLELVF